MNDTYLSQWISSSLLWTTAFRLLGDEPLSGPMITYYENDPNESNTSSWHQIAFENVVLKIATINQPTGSQLTQLLSIDESMPLY